MSCYDISAEFVLANYFLRSVDPLTFGKLREIRQDIESSIEDLVYVDISTISLGSAIEHNPNLFKWVDNTICKVESSDSLFNGEYVDKIFNQQVDEKYRRKALDVIISLT